jgi:hypothetical protein
MCLRRLTVPYVRALLLALSATLLSCGDDKCYTSAYESCQSLGTLTVTVPAQFTVACAPWVDWAGFGGNALISIGQGCGTDSMYQVDVVLPSDGGAATYTLPSAEINIDALFYPDSGPSLSLQFKSLTLVSGTVGVQSRDTYNVEADVDIQLDTETGERISITGHVLETACHLGQSKTCDN